ncbi:MULTISPECIES: competence system putative prepilin ComGE [Streptococcus]|uniref:competence system putative prepilin ComGE n=1 Tax=Streptococcus TaxID=1301 RepID=UPI001E350463|nr:competence system putative prepilin ComGE [Streptococcus acidominimus]
MATVVLAGLVTLFLGQLRQNHRQLQVLNQESQALSVATIAIQSHRQTLAINGQSIRISQISHNTIIFNHGKELFRVKVLSP